MIEPIQREVTPDNYLICVEWKGTTSTYDTKYLLECGLNELDYILPDHAKPSFYSDFKLDASVALKGTSESAWKFIMDWHPHMRWDKAWVVDAQTKENTPYPF